jgi:hypothetical protein
VVLQHSVNKHRTKLVKHHWCLQAQAQALHNDHQRSHEAWQLVTMSGVSCIVAAVVAAIGRGCPLPLTIQDPEVGQKFDIGAFEGHYYEVQLHDVTQVDDLCGCQTSNKTVTRDGQREFISDDFLMLCPKPQVARDGKVYPSHLTFNFTADKGVLNGRWPFLPGQVFPDTVVAVGWPTTNEGSYRWALEFQCVEEVGVIAFVGVNFYSRWTVDDPRGAQANSEMMAAAQKWGVYNYTGGPSGFRTINHTGCPVMV